MKRRWSNLKRLLGRGWKASFASLAVLAFIASQLGYWSTIRHFFVDHFGEDDTTLVVRSARLIPYFAEFPDSVQRDLFSLQLEIRNYGTSSVMLTSANIAMENASSAKIGPGGSTGSDDGCELSANPADNRPVEVAAGDSAWLEISPMVNLPGIRHWLDSATRSNVHVDQTSFITIRELDVVKYFNAELARRFGTNAKIAVTLFTGIRQKRRVLRFSLAEGKDMFARDGSLMHDALISYWLSPTVKVAMLDCRKHEKALPNVSQR